MVRRWVLRREFVRVVAAAGDVDSRAKNAVAAKGTAAAREESWKEERSGLRKAEENSLTVALVWEKQMMFLKSTNKQVFLCCWR